MYNIPTAQEARELLQDQMEALYDAEYGVMIHDAIYEAVNACKSECIIPKVLPEKLVEYLRKALVILLSISRMTTEKLKAPRFHLRKIRLVNSCKYLGASNYILLAPIMFI